MRPPNVQIRAVMNKFLITAFSLHTTSTVSSLVTHKVKIVKAHTLQQSKNYYSRKS